MLSRGFGGFGGSGGSGGFRGQQSHQRENKTKEPLARVTQEQTMGLQHRASHLRPLGPTSLLCRRAGIVVKILGPGVRTPGSSSCTGIRPV